MECSSKSLKLIGAGIAFVIFILQSSCNQKKACDFKEIKTMWTVASMHPGIDTTYVHSVLIKEFDRECLDSNLLVNVALKYMDTVSIDTPVDLIAFYNSDVDVDYGEPSQKADVEKNLMLSVRFDKKKPKKFVFYNNKGEIIYEGENWIKKDEVNNP